MAKKNAAQQYTLMPTLPKANIKPKKSVDDIAKETAAARNQQEQIYAKAYPKGDLATLRKANIEANALRKTQGLPVYSSAVGDLQRAGNTIKQNALKANITANTSLSKPIVPSSKSQNLGRYTMPTTYTPTNQIQDSQALISRLQTSPTKRTIAGAIQGFLPINANYAPEVQNYLNNSGNAYNIGKVGGVVGSFATGFGALGKGAVAGASKIAPKLLPRAEATTANLVQRVLPRASAETAAKIGKNIVQNNVKNIAIGLPLNANNAYNKEGLRGTDLAKSIALNTALDIGVGSALEFAPTAIKGLKAKQDLSAPVLVNGKVKNRTVTLPKASESIAQIGGKVQANRPSVMVKGKPITSAQDFAKLPESDKLEVIKQAQNNVVQPQTANLGTKLPQSLNTIPKLPYNPNKIQPVLPKASEVMPQKLQPKLGIPQKLNLGADANRFEEKAMALTNSMQIQPTKLEKLSGITSQLKRALVDSGDTVAKIARINNDDGLYNLYNNAKNARRRAEYHIGEAQTDVMGNEIGKSLKSIFEPIRKKGDDYYEDFQEYMYHLHNIDRMAQNKPVFGDFVKPDESALVADSLLKKHPEFANYSQEVRNYLNNLMQYRVDSGLVSKENADLMNEMYKNYVPTYRANPSTKGINAFGNTARVSQGIKKAKGSNKDLLPLHEQISKQTMQTVDASHKNMFGMRLVDNINPQTAKYIQELKKVDEAFNVDADILPELRNSFTIYNKGTAYEAKVDKGLYEGIKALSGKEPNELLDLATKGNAAFKELITSWNPAFLIRNFVRDLQDVGLYTKNFKEFKQSYPAAIKEITTNGKVWKQYKALGGAGNSFFDYAKGYKKDSNWLKKNTVDRIESLNQGIEQAPRLAEFMSTISKLGHEPNYDELMQAMYNSADVTVNFGRSGTWGKTLNSTFVPFFNPAVQGTSKLIRRFTETKGVKDWTSLVLRVSALGVAPSLLNEMVYNDDPEYKQLQDNVKDTNFVFKLGNGEWAKIPKGRVLSLFGSTAQRTYRAAQGEENAFAGLVKTGLQQSAPISPFESNIASPVMNAKNNRTWYGGEIEPQRVANLRPSQRYTENTTELSKRIVGAAGKLADKANFSPMKLDYILDAYSGVIGDFGMPLLTPKAETNPLKKAFVVDSVTQNRISNDFYNAKQEITYNKNDPDATLTDDVMNRYMSKVQGDLSDRYQEIRDIQNGAGSDKYKRETARSKQQEVNQIQLTALSKLKNIKEVSDKILPNYDSNDDKSLNEMSREVNKKVFGAEYALKTYNKNVYEKAKWANQNGVDYDIFYNTYFAAKANNEDGKGAIKRREAMQAIKQLDLTPQQKQRMVQALFNSKEQLSKIPNTK